ncbi:MAG: SWIM zinc finger family protein [Limnoraphis robusta]
MTSPLIAPAVQKSSGASVNHSLETALTAEIQALVPTHIQVERIQTVGVGQIPQIIYKTAKGRCSTLLSKQQFLTIWQCWLQIRHPKIEKIESLEIKASGLQFTTNQGKFWLSFPEATAFLSRYNRVAIEPLSVKINGSDAVVWNPIHQTLSQVNETGCSCADSRYRHTICKHQIAVQVCRIKPV